jgi:hypothetical protein
MSYVNGFFAVLAWPVMWVVRVVAAVLASIVVIVAFTILSCSSGALLVFVMVWWSRYAGSLPPLSSMREGAYIIAAAHFVMTATVATWAVMTIAFAFKETNRCVPATAVWCLRVGRSQSKQRTVITITEQDLAADLAE